MCTSHILQETGWARVSDLACPNGKATIKQNQDLTPAWLDFTPTLWCVRITLSRWALPVALSSLKNRWRQAEGRASLLKECGELVGCDAATHLKWSYSCLAKKLSPHEDCYLERDEKAEEREKSIKERTEKSPSTPVKSKSNNVSVWATFKNHFRASEVTQASQGTKPPEPTLQKENSWGLSSVTQVCHANLIARVLPHTFVYTNKM